MSVRTKATAPKPLAAQLKYKLPTLKLALVHESRDHTPMYPLRTPEDAAALLEPLRHAPEEHFVSLHLNAKHEVIGLHEVSHGTISSIIPSWKLS